MNDYRLSHLHKGEDYDADLARGPFDAYLSHWEAHHLSQWWAQHAAHLPPGVLDFACGTGRITRQLARLMGARADQRFVPEGSSAGYSAGGVAGHSAGAGDPASDITPAVPGLMGVDISPSMLDVARRRCPGVPFIEADLTQAEHAGTAAQPVGLITAFRFFGNAQPELRQQVLAALVARLAPGGRLLMDHHRNAGAMYARLDRLTGGSANGMDLTVPGLYVRLQAQGLEVEQVLPIGAWMWRSKLLHAAVTPERARVLEARFAAPFWAAWAPACMVVARRRL